MMPRLLCRDYSGVNLLLNQGVVAGELLHLSVANKVDPGVPNVSDQVSGV